MAASPNATFINGPYFRPALHGNSRAWLTAELKETYWISSITVFGHSKHVRLCAGAMASVLLTTQGTPYAGALDDSFADTDRESLVYARVVARQATCAGYLDQRCASLLGQTLDCASTGS